MNIIEAMSDPAIFGTAFRSPSWATWRIMLKAIFGLEMNPEEAAIFRELTGRTTPPPHKLKKAGSSAVVAPASPSSWRWPRSTSRAFAIIRRSSRRVRLRPCSWSLLIGSRLGSVSVM